MCDFADSDAAEQLLVGRVLTVKQVKELNAKDYFCWNYQGADQDNALR